MLPPDFLRHVDLARLTGVSARFSRGIALIEVAVEDLEYVALAVARVAAGGKGVEVLSVKLAFEPDTASSLRFRALVTARKILFTAHLRITGRIVINDLLQLTLTDLRAAGEGVMGDLASLAVQPELEKYADRPFALTLPASAPLQLSEIRLEAGPPPQIIATLR